MSKATLNDLVNLQNETSAVNTVNSNNAVIETAFDNTLSRNGANPSQMLASLDMNSNSIINLPAPQGADEPLRLQDYDFLTSGGSLNIPTSVNGLTYQLSEGPTTRATRLRLSEYPSILDFDPNAGTGSDDRATIVAALAALSARGSTKLFFPAYSGGLQRIYRISSTIALVSGISLVGEGMGNIGAFLGIPAVTGTKFLWTGGNSIMFNAVNVWGGGIENAFLDGGGTCAFLISLDGCQRMNFNRIAGYNFYQWGLSLNGTSSSTCSWNHFSETQWFALNAANNAAILLNGTQGFSNAAHNTFIQTTISYAGASHGLYLGGCDNNAFFFTYIHANPSTTGYGVYCDGGIVTGGFPVEQTFFHLETDNWYNTSSCVSSPASIYGLFQSGVPITNGTQLVWSGDNGVILTPNSVDDIISAASTVSINSTTKSAVLTSSSPQQVNLATLSSRNGAELWIKDLGNGSSGNKTILPSGSDKIEGASSYVISTNWGSVLLVPEKTGSNWLIKAKI